jgi:hypothetical protein
LVHEKHQQQTVAVHKGQQSKRLSATDDEVSRFNLLKNQTPQGPEDKVIFQDYHNVVVDEKIAIFEDEFATENETPYLQNNGK